MKSPEFELSKIPSFYKFELLNDLNGALIDVNIQYLRIKFTGNNYERMTNYFCYSKHPI